LAEVFTLKVLLTENVPNLGQAGESKDVADGYARNFLIPRGLATVATAGALKRVAAEKQVAQRKQAKAQAQVSTLATKLGATQVVFKAKVGEQHRLYGSITAADIADELSRKIGQPIDKRHVELEEPIRHLGTYKVPVRVGAKVVPAVTVVVEPETGAA
jgi:large subunit ribosomal protein L9